MTVTIDAWHWTADTLRDGRAIPAVGETLRHDGPLAIGEAGLHANERILDALNYAPGPVVHRVRLGGEIIRQDDKLCARERTILWSHRCDDTLLRGFARAQARSVLHLWGAPEVVKRYLETGDESLRDTAWAAARGAALDATRAVAWAAWAAMDPARDAAWAVARDARDAAWDAASQDLEQRILAAANRETP